jgi:microcompartment protein CcmL/EutN
MKPSVNYIPTISHKASCCVKLGNMQAVRGSWTFISLIGDVLEVLTSVTTGCDGILFIQFVIGKYVCEIYTSDNERSFFHPEQTTRTFVLEQILELGFSRELGQTNCM